MTLFNRLHIWKYGIELRLYRSIDEPVPPNYRWTRWETVCLFVRWSPVEDKSLRIGRWKYDGRPRRTLHIGGYRIELWRDYEDIEIPA